MEFGTLTFVALLTAIFSTILAIFIAFVAPLFSHGAKLSEFRQAWINEQRKDIAEYMGLCREWLVTWGKLQEVQGQDPGIRKELTAMEIKALVVFWRIQLRVNPLPNDRLKEDAAFLKALRDLLYPPKANGTDAPEVIWTAMAEASLRLSQETLKAEWETTKKTMFGSKWEQFWSRKKKRDAAILEIQG